MNSSLEMTGKPASSPSGRRVAIINELVPEPCQESHCGHNGWCSRLLDAPEYSAIERDPKWSHNQDGEFDKDNSRQRGSHQATDS